MKTKGAKGKEGGKETSMNGTMHRIQGEKEGTDIRTLQL